ncbi:MAG: type II toxin-antitoxin system HicA family toxin [Bacteroidetes bacterium]|nr:type II toxin-antitoxin system HicA family toxin [Bacteroidota bacterium]
MKLPLLHAREVIAALTRLGFQESHRRGSHVKLVHQDGRVIIIPYHNPVDRFTLKGALRDAEISTEEFLNAL